MSDEKNEEPKDENLRVAYQQLCESYRAIDDFRAKLLGFLPLATGGIFLLGSINTPKESLGLIGVFGLVITVGLFCYEIYGIKKCHNLIAIGKKIERKLDINGQFINRPREVAYFINEPFVAGIIYPVVLAAWMFLALNFSPPLVAALQPYALRVAIVVFIVGFVVAATYNWLLGKKRGEPVGVDTILNVVEWRKARRR